MSLELETPEEREARRLRAFELREKLIDQSKTRPVVALYLEVAEKLGVSVQGIQDFIDALDGLSDEDASSAVHMFLLQNAPERLGKVQLDDDGNMMWVPNK